jgi:hypothetical protein
MTAPRLDRITLALALALPCVTSLVLMIWAPGLVTPSAFAGTAFMLLATAAIVINTWKNAQATGSMGQLLYETNTSGEALQQQRSRWERWVRRADETAAQGRRQALLGLGVAVSAAIAASWLL